MSVTDIDFAASQGEAAFDSSLQRTSDILRMINYPARKVCEIFSLFIFFVFFVQAIVRREHNISLNTAHPNPFSFSKELNGLF